MADHFRAVTMQSHIGIRHIILDDRFRESATFAEESQRFGSAVHVTDGDVTRVWYETLHRAWCRYPEAVAGLTAYGPLFCLERWAWDHGMRVVFRVEHERVADGRFEHYVHATESPDLLQKRLVAARDAYPLTSARAAHRCPEGVFQVDYHRCASLLDDQEPLISWVIAPVARV